MYIYIYWYCPGNHFVSVSVPGRGLLAVIASHRFRKKMWWVSIELPWATKNCMEWENVRSARWVLTKKMEVQWFNGGFIWVPKMGVPQSGWCRIGNPTKIDNLGVPLWLRKPPDVFFLAGVNGFRDTHQIMAGWSAQGVMQTSNESNCQKYCMKNAGKSIKNYGWPQVNSDQYRRPSFSIAKFSISTGPSSPFSIAFSMFTRG